MDIFCSLMGFLRGDDNSMRIDAVSRRMLEDIELRYKTIADSKREMRGDMERLRGDFYKSVKTVSENGKKSRTEQN